MQSSSCLFFALVLTCILPLAYQVESMLQYIVFVNEGLQHLGAALEKEMPEQLDRLQV